MAAATAVEDTLAFDGLVAGTAERWLRGAVGEDWEGVGEGGSHPAPVIARALAGPLSLPSRHGDRGSGPAGRPTPPAGMAACRAGYVRSAAQPNRFPRESLGGL